MRGQRFSSVSSAVIARSQGLALTNRRALCVSIHDVAPRTLGACRQVADAIAGVAPALPVTLLVVPCYHGDDTVPAEFVDWIEKRLARGDEVALHGYTHRDESPRPRQLHERLRRAVYTAGEGEFAALTHDEAAQRIERGREWFARRGWPLRGFVAPAWLVSHGTWEALQRFDFAYTTTLTQFHAFEQRMVLRAPSLVYSTRSAWRRGASLGWNSALAAAIPHARCVRVGLHPADAQHGAIMRHALRCIEQLARDRQTFTKAAFAHALR
jgi:uncharacterized protein